MGFKHSSIIKYLQEAIMCFLMSWKLLAGESLLFEFGSIVGIDLHRLARGTQSWKKINYNKVYGAPFYMETSTQATESGLK